MGPLMLFLKIACQSFLYIISFILLSYRLYGAAPEPQSLTVTFFCVCVCDDRSSVICLTAPPHPSLLRGSPRGSGSPSQSPSDHLVFIKLLVTTTFSTQRVIISLPWSDCHRYPHHYPILSVLNVFFFFVFLIFPNTPAGSFINIF